MLMKFYKAIFELSRGKTHVVASVMNKYIYFPPTNMMLFYHLFQVCKSNINKQKFESAQVLNIRIYF